MAKRMKTALKRTGTNAATAIARLCDKFLVANADAPDVTVDTVNAGANPRSGRYSGLPVARFQQWVMSCSADGDMLTDVEMAKIFTVEFPRSNVVVNNTDQFPVNYLTNMRTQYNSGSHSGMTKRPDKPCPKIIIVDGQRIIDPTWAKKYDPKTGNRIVKTAAK